LQADVASGGGPGRTLKSFYPLFPKFAYFTEASINAPINFIDVFPSVTVQPLRNFAIKVGIDVLWRYSVQDAFYQPPGVPFVPGSANQKRFLGAAQPPSRMAGDITYLRQRRLCSLSDGRISQSGRCKRHRLSGPLGIIQILRVQDCALADKAVKVSRALEFPNTMHQPHVSVPWPRRAVKPPSGQKKLFEVVKVAGDFSTIK
jgi:hypothetical protein